MAKGHTDVLRRKFDQESEVRQRENPVAKLRLRQEADIKSAIERLVVDLPSWYLPSEKDVTAISPEGGVVVTHPIHHPEGVMPGRGLPSYCFDAKGNLYRQLLGDPPALMKLEDLTHEQRWTLLGWLRLPANTPTR